MWEKPASDICLEAAYSNYSYKPKIIVFVKIYTKDMLANFSCAKDKLFRGVIWEHYKVFEQLFFLKDFEWLLIRTINFMKKIPEGTLQKHIQKPAKQLRWCLLQKIVSAFLKKLSQKAPSMFISICEPMSRRRSIYVVFIWSVFLFHFYYN